MTYTDEFNTAQSIAQRADAEVAALKQQAASLTASLVSAQAALSAAQADDTDDDDKIASLSSQVQSLTAQVQANAAMLTSAQTDLAAARQNATDLAASLAASQAQAKDLATLLTGVRADLAAAQAALSAASVPTGYTALSAFPGATWVDKLAAASGKVWVPKDIVTPIDAAWTDTRRQLIVIAKAITHLKWQQGCVIKINRMTSTYWTRAMIKALATTPITILQQTGGSLVEFTGFPTLVGSEQGHHFHGWSFFNCRDLKVVEINVVGANEGEGGSPPDESFAGTVRGATDAVVRLRANGQFDDGTNGSAVGFTFQQCLRCVLDVPDLSHWRASTVVFYQSANCGIQGGKLDRDSTKNDVFGSGCQLNLEQTTGTWLKGVEFSGGVPGYDVNISMAGDQSTLVFGSESFSLNDATVVVDDCKGGAAWPGSTKDGLVTFRYWGQDVTKRNSDGTLSLAPDFAPGGRFASLGVTLANVDAKGYPLLGGRHIAYDSRPAGVKRSGLVRVGGQPVSSFTSAYGKTMVGPGGQPIPSAAG